MAGYRGPSIDHGLLSRTGRENKRGREYLMADYERRLSAWWSENHPDLEPPTEAEIAKEKAQYLRRHAARLRELAARGMSVRKFTREADKAEAEAAALERSAEKTRETD